MTKPSSTTHREAPPRKFVDWTPGLLRAAEKTADSGMLRLAADLCDDIMADDRVQGVLGTRVQGLLKLPLTFHSEGADSDEEATREEEALDKDFWKALPETELRQFMSWGVLLGVGVGELVWEHVGERVVPRLKVWHPRWLRYDWHSREWKLTVDDGTELVITPGDGKWAMYTPYGSRRPWAGGVWRALGLLWLVKRFAMQDWARYSEAHGSATKVGYAPAGVKAETRKELAADLDALVQGGSIALPPGYDIKVVEASAKTWDTFQAQIGLANTSAAIAITGQNLTTEVGGGSFAAAAVHQVVRHDLIEGDSQTLSTTLHEQVLSWWAEFNFGDGTLAPWPMWDVAPPEDTKAKADNLRTFGEAVNALRMAEVRVDVPALAKVYGVPLLEAAEGDEDAALGDLYQYHFEFGIVTINEARSRLGLPPIAGGDEPAVRMAPEQAATLLRALRAEARAHRRGKTGDALALQSEQARIVKLSRIRAPVLLASGKAAPPGLVEGHEYAEALALAAKQRATELMRADIANVKADIDAATSTDDLKARLVKRYREMDPTALAALTEKAILLSELAGRLAVIEGT
jgi:phage gp29-like protein